MADNPFDRTVINVRERPISSDINQAQSQMDRTMRFVLQEMLRPRSSLSVGLPGPPVSGFVGNGFNVRADSPAGLSVVVGAGMGFYDDAADAPSAIGGVAGVDDLNRYKPLLLLSDATIAVPAADPTNPRIDIVEAAINRRLDNPTSRDVLNAVTGVFEPQTVNKTLAWNVGTSIDNTTIQPASSTAALSYKQGIPSATPSIPSTSAGYVKVAEILVAASVTQVNQNNIKDVRLLLGHGGVRRLSAKGTFNAGAVSLDALQAPPGVLAALNDSGGTQRLYIKAGDVSGLSPIALVSRATTAGPTGFTASIVNVDTALQTALATAADTDPVLPVADDFPGLATSGQKLILVDLLQIVDDTYNILVEW